MAGGDDNYKGLFGSTTTNHAAKQIVPFRAKNKQQLRWIRLVQNFPKLTQKYYKGLIRSTIKNYYQQLFAIPYIIRVRAGVRHGCYARARGERGGGGVGGEPTQTMQPSGA